MGKKIAELDEDRDAGKPGVVQRLESFRAERILLVNSIIQVRALFGGLVRNNCPTQTEVP